VTEQILDMMRQWLEQLEQQKETDHSSAQEPLQRLFDAGLAQQMPWEHTELLLKLTRQSESFNRFATALLEQTREGSIDREQLLEQLKQHLDELSRDWVMHSWKLPEQLGVLMGLFSCQSPTPEDSLSHFAQLLTSLLSSLQPHARPDLIAQLKENLSLLERFERARAGYITQLSTLNSLALEQMNQQLETASLTDPDHLHQLWIECYETVYQAHLGSPEYSQALGEISNAAMALRLGWQNQRDRICSALGLVTDTRHDELAERHHQLRRRVRKLEQELSALRHTLEPVYNKDADAQDQC